jgi:hypothetical protein
MHKYINSMQKAAGSMVHSENWLFTLLGSWLTGRYGSWLLTNIRTRIIPYTQEGQNLKFKVKFLLSAY